MTKAEGDALLVLLKAMNISSFELMAYDEARMLDREQADLEMEGLSMSIPAIIEQHKCFEVSEASEMVGDYWDKVAKMYVLVYKGGF